ncbi:MAG: hypothetical protein O3A63_03765 [Proteobacteria bacterium]|nr:hypothetical protein [Pseudomonadota bacterium]
MSINQRRRRRSASEWSSIVADFRESGLSARAFCHETDVALSTFTKWLRRQRLVETTPTAPRFVALEGEVSPSVSSWEMELDLGDGMTLRLRRQG